MKESDIVMTPDWAAKIIVDHFKPAGKVLDPCKGDGAFSNLIKNCDWCEIREGKDFYEVDEVYDWVISNPPYSCFSDFLRHTFTVANNIVYLIPANKVFNSYKMMKEIKEYGGVKEMLVIAPGSKLKFPIGFCIAAVHFQSGYDGDMRISFAC